MSIDLDDLLNTGITDATQTEIEPELLAISADVRLTPKKVDYTKVDRTTRFLTSPARYSDTPNKNTVEQFIENETLKDSADKRTFHRTRPLIGRKETVSVSSSTVYGSDEDKKKRCQTCNTTRDDIDISNALYSVGTPDISFLDDVLYIAQDKGVNESQLSSLITDDVFNTAVFRRDPWSSVPLPSEIWTNCKVDQEGCIVNVESMTNGFNIEAHGECVGMTTHLWKYSIVETEKEYPYFKKHFHGKKSVKFYIDTTKLILLAVDTSTRYRRGIVMTPKGIVRVVFPPGIDYEKTEKVWGSEEKDKRVKSIKKNSEKIESELEKIEMMEIGLMMKMKVGVIYVKKDQNEENALFSNDVCECNEQFWEFMNGLGERIKLEHWERYKGGLDVKKNCTGTFSYFRQYNEYQIMFHVAPLLPNQEDDPQKLERKRHVGNDVVVVIYLEKERTEPFDVRILTSHFNNVFILVKPEDKTVDGKTEEGYRICVVTKPNNKPFPPFIKDGWMKKNIIAYDFLLKKMINGERVTMHNTTFASNAKNTRREQLKAITAMV